MTELDVANRALMKLGASSISSLEEDKKAARVMKDIVASVRDQFLRDNVWNPAVERAILSKSSTAPAWGWASKYPLPADYIKMITVESGSESALNIYVDGDQPVPVKYRIEGGYIMCDETGALWVRYVKRLTDMTRYDSMMIEALATLYAKEACMAISNDISLKNLLYDEYRMLLDTAKKQDGWEDGSTEYQEDEYIAVRR